MSDARARDVVLLLGMHRSGTSAVARALALLGAELGRDLLPPREDNIKGFWENAAFVRLHERLLAQLDLRWHDVAPGPPDWCAGADADGFRSDLARELDTQIGAAPLAAVKDPRMSLFVPLWRDVLAATDRRASALIVLRDPREVAASLARRDGFPAAKSLLLWLHNVIEAERATRGLPRVFVAYDRFLADWRSQIERVRNALGLDWPRAPDAAAAAIEDHLDPSLRHHQDGGDDASLPPLLRDVYALMQRAARDGVLDTAAMDRHAARFDEMLALAGPALLASEHARADETEEHLAEVARARDVVAAKDAEIAEARTTIEGLVADIAAARTTIEGLVADAAAARAAIDALQAQLDRARDVVELKDAEIAAARVAVDQLTAQLDGARVVIDLKDQEIDRARQTIDSKVAEIDRARRNIDGAMAELAHARELLLTKDTELERARVAYDTLRHEYNLVIRGSQGFGAALRARVLPFLRRRDGDDLQSKLDDLDGRLDGAEVRLRERQDEIDRARAVISAKDAEIDAAARNIDDLTAQIAASAQIVAAKDRELEAARRAADELAARIGKAREAIDLKHAEVTAAAAHIDALAAELAAAARVAALKDAEIARARDVIAGKDDELASAQRVVAGKDAEIAAAQRVIAGKNEEIDAARRAVEDQERQLEAARSLIAAKDVEIDMARTAHAARDERERQLDAEVARLAAELARAAAGVQPLAATLRFALDTPADGVRGASPLRIGGWCFGTDGREPTLRVRVHERECALPLHIERPDVARSFPQSTISVRCGFEAEFELPEGSHRCVLEALDGDAWIELAALNVEIEPAPLHAAIDTPAALQCEAGTVRFSGWCVHPERRIQKLRLVVGNASADCRYGLVRDDVAAALPQASGAVTSGFESALELPPGNWPYRFEALLDSGATCVYHGATPVLVRRPLTARRLQRGVASVGNFTRFALAGTRDWMRANKRLPWPWEWPSLLRFGLDRYYTLRREQVARVPAAYTPPPAVDPYAAWQAVNRFGPRARADLEARLARATNLPLLSVVIPVYEPPLKYLRACIDSLRAQVYAQWELCIADDASRSRGVQSWLRKLAAEEPRVRLVRRSENGNISRATNSAAELARGEFLVFVDQDDLLTPDALGEMALACAAAPDVDIVYSDDDKIGAGETRFAPQFKPGWSPELLLSYMYFSHIFAVRRELFERVGGMRVGYEGSQDYDFALRATELARRIEHVPQVLYHWRVLPGSTASSGSAKPASLEAGRRAVANALQRRGVAGEAVLPEWAEKAGCGIFGIRFPDSGPRVSIVIPTKNGLDVLRRCIDSLARTSYADYEVIVVDNESDDPATLEYLKSLPHRVERIPNPAGRFNYAWINNRAAERATGEYVLFLNNDTEVVEPRWLSQMVGYARLPGVGAVGARLLFPDGRIQHAGIVHGYYRGLAGPAFKLLPAWNNGYLSYAKVARNYSAATAACLLTPRATFLAHGGFDAERFEVAYNDVDYCYRLADAGLRTVYCADAELLHYEGHTRGYIDRPEEVATFRRRYFGRTDPYYSPHLTLDDEQFGVKPRRVRGKPAAPVRALMCAFNLNWEGAPFSQLELTLGLKRAGLVDPVVYSPNDGPLRAQYEAAGIPVHVFAHPLTSIEDRAAYDGAIEAFAKFVDTLNVDLVYGNTVQTFYAIAAAHRRGLPSLWNPRESENWADYFNFLPAPLIACALDCFAHPYRVIFVAEATRRVWAPLDSRGNFTVIHNGLDLERLRREAAPFERTAVRAELGIGADELLVLLPGTVCERKAQAELVNALAGVDPALWPRLRCCIVGDRPSTYSEKLHALVAALPDGLRERVALVPETHQIARYYRAADLFVCTSRVESFPRIVLEAMAHGLPVISTRVYGVVEQVGEGVNALLYEPGDAAQLTRHLERLLGDDALRARFATNAPYVLATLNDYAEMVQSYGTLFAEAALVDLEPEKGSRPQP